MPQDLVVRLRVPTSRNRILVLASPIIFTKWAPFEASDAFEAVVNGLPVRVSFDQTCLAHVSEIDVSTHVNVMIGTILMDVRLLDVPDDVVEFILASSVRTAFPEWDEDSDAECRRLAAAYHELGVRVQAAASHVTNRIIGYARVQMGQFWLEPAPEDPANLYGYFGATKAKVASRDSDWVRWAPPPWTMNVGANMGPRDRFVTESEWPSVVEFVKGEARPDLVRELLANADELFAEGFSRAALIEGVAALEVAFFRFARSPDVEALRNEAPECLERVDLDRLEQQAEHLGFSGSMRYLLPLITSASICDPAILRNCSEAIAERGNVVHQGQRDVKEQKLKVYLDNIRSACTTLEGLTLPS